MSETRDSICVSMDHILQCLPVTPSQPSIFRVDDNLRCGSEKHYDPKILSIGPFHHGKVQLQKMEQHKHRYLKLLLERMKESTIDKFVNEMRSLEEEARTCYAELPDKFKSSDDFVQMLLLDGCFTIEFIRKLTIPDMRKGDDDPIFKSQLLMSKLVDDLILVENQLPFSVLYQLFTMTMTPDDEIHNLVKKFIGFISSQLWSAEVNEKISLKNADHLFGFLYRFLCSSFIKKKMDADNRPEKKDEEKSLSMNCATELQEAGIKFEKDTKSHWLDVMFVKGVMKIPQFTVEDSTETIIRNLIAYEQCFSDDRPQYVTHYTFLLQCLINSSKDVEVLRRNEIVTNWIGDDEMVCRMFNGMGKNILISRDDACYRDVYYEVKRHCNHRRNKWMANLKRNYFNSPWAYVAFGASLMLLLLTLIQTAFSVLAYEKSK